MNRTLMSRALLALMLMIGFYALALGIGLFLLLLPVFLTLWSHSFNIGLIKIYILSFIGGAIIIWSILPRFERFQAPGLKLNLNEHLPLKRMLQDLSAKTGQKMPDEVYLIFENNAWVQENIGFLGLFRKRRMAVGLPLMHMLTEQEFKAVLAHEYGHYHGGDTRLGAFIYQTRSALFRTVQNMSDNFIGKIFIAYGNMYLKLTHGISRTQEYQADRFAASHTSAAAMTAALQKVGHLGGSFDHYWSSEVVPILNSGYKPPIMGGYYSYLEVPRIQDFWKNHYEQSNEEEHALQTHPSMHKRIEALGKLEHTPEPPSEQFALNLLRDPAQQELNLLKFLGGQEAFSKLQNIDWDTVGEQVWMPFWREASAKHRHLFVGQTLENITLQLLDDTRRFRLFESMRHPSDPQGDGYPWMVVRFLFAVGLYDAGWKVEARPGASVQFSKDGQVLCPLDDLTEMQNGENRGLWLENLRKAGMEHAILFKY